MDQPRSERTATDRRPNGYAEPPALVGFLKSLRTVRFFEQNKPVPENVLQDVLEVARWSGSAQPTAVGVRGGPRPRDTRKLGCL
jgi:hypothetical protein